MSNLPPNAWDLSSREIPGNSAGGHRVQGAVAIIDRRQPLPDVCILTGAPATQRVRSLFHLQNSFLAGGPGPVEVLFELLCFYIQDVPKAMLRLPLSDALCRRRTWGWIFFGMTIVSAIATIVGLIVSQQWITAMPAGPQKKWLNMWLVPGIALGGFIPLALSAYLSDRLMPVPSRQLKVQAITDTHVWLAGAAPEFFNALQDSQKFA